MDRGNPGRNSIAKCPGWEAGAREEGEVGVAPASPSFFPGLKVCPDNAAIHGASGGKARLYLKNHVG